MGWLTQSKRVFNRADNSNPANSSQDIFNIGERYRGPVFQEANNEGGNPWIAALVVYTFVTPSLLFLLQPSRATPVRRAASATASATAFATLRSSALGMMYSADS